MISLLHDRIHNDYRCRYCALVISHPCWSPSEAEECLWWHSKYHCMFVLNLFERLKLPIHLRSSESRSYPSKQEQRIVFPESSHRCWHGLFCPQRPLREAEIHADQLTTVPATNKTNHNIYSTLKKKNNKSKQFVELTRMAANGMKCWQGWPNSLTQ